MLAKTTFNAVVILGVSIACVSYMSGREAPTTDNAKIAAAVVNAPPARKTQTAAKPRSASVVSIPKDRRSGQYHTTARVNSGYVEFLVDTGASAVALTLEDARKAGVDVRSLRYTVPVSTAGGRNYAAAVQLDSLAVGGIRLRNVQALVIREGLDTSLLGMTWLGQLQEVKATPNALMLRL